MGVYNTINIPMPCPNCGATVEWQSKDLAIRRYTLANLLDHITLEEDMSGEMHTSCDKCRHWTDAEIVDGKIGKVTTTPLPRVRT